LAIIISKAVAKIAIQILIKNKKDDILGNFANSALKKEGSSLA
jgi:hypothetical protein